jgi:RimJ/RimL family protein N-acetyltransferase
MGRSLGCAKTCWRVALGESPRIRLLHLDDAVLDGLLQVAVADADPEEVMPPVDGPPGWTPQRREAFRVFHLDRSAGLSGPMHEATYAVQADGRIVGSARLERKDSPAVLEAGLWLARSARGHGIGTAVLRALLAEAASSGAETVTAETTTDNHASQTILRRAGAVLTIDERSGRIRAELPASP